MSFLTGLFSNGAAKLVDAVSGLADQFFTSKEEKMNFLHKFEQELQKRDSEIEQTIRTELKAKTEIMVAELQQGDNYTKRARPTVVYFGLFATFWNYMLVPTVQALKGVDLTAFPLPGEFWAAWGGVTGVYVLGRSAEKRGAANRGTELMTGSGANNIMKKLLD